MEFLYYNWLPTICDHILDLPYQFYKSAGALPRHNYPDFIVENIKDGDLVFIKTDLLEYFFNNYYNKINVKIILITGISSITINPKYEEYLNDKIYYWIGPNIPWNNENTLKIPIGFEERDRDGGDQKVLNDALKYININKKNILVVSYMSDTHPTRKQFIEKYKDCDYIDFLDKLKFKDYIAKLGEYQFVLCPPGVGTDTHRFWETLLVGGIPIVETSSLDDLYSKFPCIIVKSILDIDRNLLIKPDISTNEIKNYLLTNNLKKKIFEIKYNYYSEWSNENTVETHGYDKIEEINKEFSNKCIDVLKSLNKDYLKIVDFGCGNGRFFLDLKKKIKTPFYYTGIDVNKKNIENAKKFFKNENNCEFIIKNINNIQYDDIKNYNDCILYFDSTFNMINNQEYILKLFEKLNNVTIIFNRCNILKNQHNNNIINIKHKWTGMDKCSDNYHFALDFFNELKLYDKYILCEDNYKYMMLLVYNFKDEIKENNNISSIKLPVSIGEALDKLTILDIKQRKINDKNKLNDVIKEYNLLKNELNDIMKENIQFYYNKLVLENETIWDMLDDIKNTKYDDKEKLKLYEIMWHKNDCRYRLKQKINSIVNSDLKEQKGYKQTKAFVLTHLGMGDMIDCVGMIRYLSIQYDIVDVVCKNKYKNNVEQMFNDDKNIHIINVEEDCDISPNYGYPKKLYENIIKDYDKVYLCGNHLKMRNNEGDYSRLPFEFYEDINLDNSIYWNYFHISTPDNSKLLYNNLLNKKYIFVHDTSSLGKIFNIKEYEDRLNINDDDYIYINPCTNLYDKNHKYYDLCEQFVDLPLFDYIDTIKNASFIIITDSAFFSLSVQLEINTDKCYYVTRYISRYVFWDDKYIYKNININRQKFKRLDKMEPHFAGDEDLNMFYKYLKNANYYFEYGSGGSTYQSSICNNIKKVYSVESCLEYHLKLKEICENKYKITFIYNEMDVKPNTWGHSGINATDEQKINYSNHITKLSKLEQEQIDLILIDGRFRVSCCLKCFDIINENTHILFDDFMNRPEYHIVLKYFDIIEKTNDNCMVCLKKKSDIVIDQKDILYYNLKED